MQRKLSFVSARITIEQLLGQHELLARCRELDNKQTKCVFIGDETEARFFGSDWMIVYQQVLTFVKSLPNATAN